jgi:hypothetical protein
VATDEFELLKGRLASVETALEVVTRKSEERQAQIVDPKAQAILLRISELQELCRVSLLLSPFGFHCRPYQNFLALLTYLSLTDWLHDAQLVVPAGKLEESEQLLFAPQYLVGVAKRVWRQASIHATSHHVPQTWGYFRTSLEAGLGVQNMEVDTRETLSSLVQKSTVQYYFADFQRLHSLGWA